MKNYRNQVPEVWTPSTDCGLSYNVGGWAFYDNNDRNNPYSLLVAIYNCEEGARVAVIIIEMVRFIIDCVE